MTLSFIKPGARGGLSALVATPRVRKSYYTPILWSFQTKETKRLAFPLTRRQFLTNKVIEGCL